METTAKPSIFERYNNWVKGSVMLKIITIGILILLLMIPASMLENLVNERQSSRVEEETINFDAQINLNGSKRIDFYLSENH